MAGDGVTTEHLELAVDGKELDPLLRNINLRIGEIVKTIRSISTESHAGVQRVFNNINKEVKSLQQALSAVQTLERLSGEAVRQGSRPVRDAMTEQSLGKRAIAAGKYRQSLASASSALEVLEARENALIRKGQQIAAQGLIPDKAMVRTQQRLKDTRLELNKLERSFVEVDRKARRAGGDFSPERKGYLDAMAALRTAAGDGRRSNFTAEIEAVNTSLDRYNKSVSEATLSRTRQLQIEKRLATDQIRNMTTVTALDEARERNQRQIRLLTDQVTSANVRNKNVIYEQLQIEHAKETAIRRQTRELQRQNAQQQQQPGGGLDGRRSVGNILSPGYAAAAFARTSVYGMAAMGAYSVFDAVRGGVQFVTEFEDGMKRLQAITNSTNTQMLNLSETILGVSKSSRYATRDLVDSARVLAQAGLSVQGIAETLPSISQLATASGESLQQTTDVVTSALGSFQLNVEETAHIADVLTASLNYSKLNLQHVALGIQYAGQTAKENNIAFEELVAIFATMSQAGIRSGSTQGTGLRQFLNDLISPTEKLHKEFKRLGLSLDDVNVRTRGLPAVLETLAAKGYDASAAYDTLQVRAAAAYLVMKNNTDEIARQIELQQQSALAAEASAKAMGSLTSQWQRFKNVAGAYASEKAEPTLKFLTAILKTLSDISEQSDKVQQELDRLAEGKNYSADDVLGRNFRLTPLAKSEEEKTLIRQLREQLLEYENALAGAEKRAVAFAEALDPALTKINDLTGEIENQETKLKSLDSALASINMKKGELTEGSASLRLEIATLTSRFPELALEMDAAKESADSLWRTVHKLREEAAQALPFIYATRAAAHDEAVNTSREALASSVTELMKRKPNWRNRFGLTRDDQRDIGLAQRGVRADATDEERAAGLHATRRLTGRRAQLQKENPTAAEELGKIISPASTAYKNIADREADALYYRSSQFSQTPTGQRIVEVTSNLLGDSTGKLQAHIDHLDRQIKVVEASEDSAIDKEAAIAFLMSERQRAISSRTPDVREPKSSTRTSDRERNRALRNEHFVSRDMQQLVEKELNMHLKRAKGSTSDALFEQAAASARASLEEWAEITRKVARDEIARKKMSPEQAARYMAQVEQEIDNKREETNDKIIDSFFNNLKEQLAEIDHFYEALDRDSKAHLSALQGRLSGLDRYSLRDVVTPADRIMAERDIARAQETYDRNRLNFLGLQEEDQMGVLDRAREKEREARAALQADPANQALQGEWEKINKGLRESEERLHNIRQEKLLLNAAFEAGLDLPQTFTEHLDKALAAYHETNVLTRSFEQHMAQGLMGTLDSVHQSFGTFFTDVITGTRNVADAFGDMALSILRALNQMVAQAAANQIFGALIGLAGGALGGGAGKTLQTNVPSFGYGFNGGLAANLPRGYFSGGLVTNGSRGHDSVLAKLRRDEFVMQPMAVDSVGVDFMNDLNKRGAQALKELTGSPLMLQQNPAQTNVYVVAPEYKQQLGPNDVKIIIQDDVLRGGQMKKLIQSVAAGA